MADIMTPPASADSGSQGSNDPTWVSGQQPDSLFGVTLPTSTGAPGSASGAGGDDPTTEPGQVPATAPIAHTPLGGTGAPGSAGAPRRAGGAPVTVTDPNYTAGRPGGGSGVQSVTVPQNVGGPNDSTAPVGNYPPTHPLAGTPTPTSTGAGQGTVRRGGRGGRS